MDAIFPRIKASVNESLDKIIKELNILKEKAETLKEVGRNITIEKADEDGCFENGSLVLRVIGGEKENEQIPIESLLAGDVVMTVDDDNNLKENKVFFVSLHQTNKRDMVSIRLASNKIIKTTSNHMMVVKINGN